MFWRRPRLICPNCLCEINAPKHAAARCPRLGCDFDLPPLYLDEYRQVPPVFVQIFGWSGTGKTVFLYALTLLLARMSKVWPQYSYSPSTTPTVRTVREVTTDLERGVLPQPTPLGLGELYIMLLRGMERWGGRTLITRDCAGEYFDSLQVPLEQAPFLLNTPTAFMFVSPIDLRNNTEGRSLNMLMDNYINTLLSHKVNFNKKRRSLVVVVTKADIIPDLPANLRQYLIHDPIWNWANTQGRVPQMDALSMATYLEQMGRVSDEVEAWLQRDAAGQTFVRLAKHRNIDLRFSVISSTGAPVEAGNQLPAQWEPRRVLDPFFWALELQSRA